MKKAQRDIEQGDLRFAATALNYLVFAQPNHKPAADLLASAYRRLGYRSESGPWRDFYLTGARELTNPLMSGLEINTSNPDMIANLPIDLFFDLMAVRGERPQGGRARYQDQFCLYGYWRAGGAAPQKLCSQHAYG